VLDGETRGSFLAPLESGKLWTENEFNTQTLIDAPFAIDVSTVDTEEGMIEVQASVTSKIANPNTGPLRLFFLLVEKEVEVDNVMFKNVVRKILPSAAGYALPQVMTLDLPVTITAPELSWVVNNANINPANLAVVAFIQNLETRKVYQTAIDENPANLPTLVTGVENPAFAKRIQVYPNPSNEEVNIVLPEVSKSSTPLRLTDSFGREITATDFKPGQQSKILNTKDLSAGVYFIQLKTEKGIAVRKLVVAH
jgi:hypothetical protein